VSLKPATDGEDSPFQLGRDVLGDVVVGPCPVVEAFGSGLQVAAPPRTCLAGPAWKKPRFFHLLGRYLAQMIIKVLSPAQVQLANSQGISSTQLVQYTCTNALRR
jgi:hypothetical protein